MSSDSIHEEADTIENIYKKKSPLEHILLRPDSYVGSIKSEEKTLWIYDEAKNAMTEKKMSYNPALYKIFDEILVNASDNKIRDPKMSAIRIDINGSENMIRIWNNGKGVPVVVHKDTNVYVPTMIFGQLLTSTNFNDDKKQVTGGRNGYGAKLCNIFSTKFVLETSSSEYKKSFKQTWTGNMSSCTDPIIGKNEKEDFTCVTFYPDLQRFGMTHLDENIISLFCRRAFDMAACTNGIIVHLNGRQLPVKNFKDYVELYTKGCSDGSGEDLKVTYEKYGDRWEVAMTTSVTDNFTQVSFVNSIATTKGGTHVNYVVDQAAAKLLEIAKKKIKNDKQAVKLKPAQVKMNTWIFVKCLIENPSFDSQTKENMTLHAKDFGSTCTLSDKFINQLSKCGIVEKVTLWANFKDQALLNKKCSKTKQSKLKDIPKLDDANHAGTKNSIQCKLFLTEGDSAKTLVVSGMSVIGRDYYGVFPLKGKLLNVREASTKQLSDNVEISNLIKILGLQYQQKYELAESLKTLRYGKLVLMTDQDQDGSHIKGLVINFIHSKWPNLLKHNFVEQFITPIVKVDKNKTVLSFYSIPEFLEWEKNTPNSDKWTKKYYKGLGTSTSKEAKEYFTDMERHLIKFEYSGEDDGKSIVMAFSKDKADERKEWLTKHMEETKRRRNLGLADDYLYGKGTKAINFDNFIHKELVLFSNTDNERSIPCMMDGFKPGQRKVLYACFKRKLVKELKVAQLAGSVAELSAYHHGEASLMGTIINLAQDYVGSNNINLLMPGGQFGTRLTGGKDSASPRYIFTQLNKITRLIFHPQDEAVLKFLSDDNQRIEPEWYAPIIPMVLVNGCDGIGTGWSSKIPNFNPQDILDNVRRVINGESLVKMHPWYRGFRGTIQEICENKYQISGEIGLLGENCVEITELPIRTWTSPYKESVMEIYRNGSDKCPAMISDYKEYNTDTTVRFVVEMTSTKMAEAEAMGLHKFFKVQSQLALSNMILFDECGVIKKYNTAEDILRNFCRVRMELYGKRKTYLLGVLSAEASKLENQARFILEKIDGKIVCENIKVSKLIEILIERNYDSDPIKVWKRSVEQTLSLENDSEETTEKDDPNKPDFEYLTHMRILDLTEDKKKELLENRDKKLKELEITKRKSPSQFWLEDLDNLEKALKELYNPEKIAIEEQTTTISKVVKKGGKTIKVAAETAPSKFAVRVEPKLEEDLLKKLTADVEKKKQQTVAKKQKQMMEQHFAPRENGDTRQSMDTKENDEDLSLAERLAMKGNQVVGNMAKTVKQPRVKEINKAKETKKKSPAQKRKKAEWESDSDENVDIDDASDIDSDHSAPLAPVRNSATKTDTVEASTVADTSGSFKQLVNPVQSTLTGFIRKSDNSEPPKSKKLLPMEKKAPAAKKAKLDKPASKPKSEPKTAKPKAVKEPKAIKEPKAVKEPKKPVAPKKTVNLSTGEEDIGKENNKPRRQVAQKVYIVSDDEGSDGMDDSDFDISEHMPKSKGKKKVFSDSD